MKIVADENLAFTDYFFSSFGEIQHRAGRLLTAEDVHDAQALIVRSVTKVNAALIQDSQLQFVGSATIGTDHLITGIMMAALVVAPLAEAKRAGGGKSHGMSRSAAPTQSYQQPRQVTPAPQTAPAGTPQRSGPGVGTVVAAGVAGAAVGALAANAMADDKHTTSPEQQATQAQQQQQEEKKRRPTGLDLDCADRCNCFLYFPSFRC